MVHWNVWKYSDLIITMLRLVRQDQGWRQPQAGPERMRLRYDSENALDVQFKNLKSLQKTNFFKQSLFGHISEP